MLEDVELPRLVIRMSMRYRDKDYLLFIKNPIHRRHNDFTIVHIINLHSKSHLSYL